MLGIFLAPIVSGTVVLYLLCGTVICFCLWQKRVILIAALCIVLFISGAERFNFSGGNELEEFYGQKIDVTGTIVADPDIRPDKIQITLGDLEISDQKHGGKLLVQVPRYPEYEYGARIKVSGKILEPRESEDFSYKKYLERFGISAVIFNPKIIYSQGFYGNRISSVLYRIKNNFIAAVSRKIPEPENSLLVGILLGQKRGIPQTIIDQFIVTGTSHIIALSGFNITIIINNIARALNRFGRRASFIISMVLIILFVIMTGASASVVRAAVMGIMAQFATNIGRIYSASNAIALTAVVMLVQNPKLLQFDVGFQLSFLAVLGLVYLTPFLESKFPNTPKPIKEYLFPTLAAQAATAPFIFIFYYQISLISPLINLLVLPLVPVAMTVGFFTGLLELVVPPLATVLGFMTWLILHLILLIIELGSRIPFAAIHS